MIELSKEDEQTLRSALEILQSLLKEENFEVVKQTKPKKAKEKTWNIGMKRNMIALMKDVLSRFGDEVIDRNDPDLFNIVVISHRTQFASFIPSLQRLERLGYCDIIWTKPSNNAKPHVLAFQLKFEK